MFYPGTYLINEPLYLLIIHYNDNKTENKASFIARLKADRPHTYNYPYNTLLIRMDHYF